MNIFGTIKSEGAIDTDVDSHNCVQYTLENRITAEVALIHKKEVNQKHYKRKKWKERDRKEGKIGRAKKKVMELKEQEEENNKK